MPSAQELLERLVSMVPALLPWQSVASGPSFASRATGRGAKRAGSWTHQRVRNRPERSGQRAVQKGRKEQRGTGTALFSRSGIFPGTAQCPWQACDKAAPGGRGEETRAQPLVSLVLPRVARRPGRCIGPGRAGCNTGMVPSDEATRMPRESASGAVDQGAAVHQKPKPSLIHAAPLVGANRVPPPLRSLVSVLF